MTLRSEVFEMLSDCGRLLSGEETNLRGGVNSIHVTWHHYLTALETRQPSFTSPLAAARDKVSHWLDVARLAIESSKALGTPLETEDVLEAVRSAAVALVEYMGYYIGTVVTPAPEAEA